MQSSNFLMGTVALLERRSYITIPTNHQSSVSLRKNKIPHLRLIYRRLEHLFKEALSIKRMRIFLLIHSTLMISQLLCTYAPSMACSSALPSLGSPTHMRSPQPNSSTSKESLIPLSWLVLEIQLRMGCIL